MKKYLFCLLIFFISNSESNGQWEKIGFENVNIPDLTLFNDLIIIPVRSQYSYTLIYGSEDNGETWDSLSYVDKPWLEEVEGSEKYLFVSTFWLCAGFCYPSPCIFRFTTSFSSCDTLFERSYGVSNLLTNQDIVFASAGNYLIKSTDHGSNWDTINLSPREFGKLFAIGNSIYYSNSIKELFRSNDGGLNWDPINYNLQANIYSLIQNNSYLFAGTPAGILRSSDNGLNWDFYNEGFPENFAVWGTAGIPGIIFCAGEDTNYSSSVFYSTNNGEYWINITEGLLLGEFDYINTLLIRDKYLFAATENGIWRYNFSSLVGINQDIKSFKYSLDQNYPNPFNPNTLIRYSLLQKSKVLLEVYDLLGREITELVNEEKTAGEYEFQFDASKYNLSSGIYFYRLQAGEYIQTRKMTYLK